MLRTLGEAILGFFASERVLSLLKGKLKLNILLLCGLLSLFFLFSRRMAARVQEAPPAWRWMPKLAQKLLPKEPEPGTEKERLAEAQPPSDMLVFFQGLRRAPSWLLQKADWLMYDKLKLLPDTHTGKRLSLPLMLFSSWLASYGVIEFLAEIAREALEPMRRADITQFLQPKQLGLVFIMLASFVLFVLPFLFVRRNRETYFDITALFMLLIATSSIKLFNCWATGCCFGVPFSWGVYHAGLDATVFPVQLVEAVVGFLLAILCILYMLYGKTYRPGRGCTFCAISYFVPRFFLGYLRYQKNSVGLQILCVMGVLIAIAWLFLLPIEKKLMDGLWNAVARRLHKARNREVTI